MPCRPPVAGRGSVAGLRMAGLRMDGLRVDGLRMDGLRVDGLRVDGLRVAGRGLRRHRRLRCRGSRAVEAVQVVEAHERDEVGAVLRVGRVHAREVVGEGVGDRAVGHGPLVVAAGGEQFGVVRDGLSDVVVDPERRVDRHPLAVEVFGGRQQHAASRPASLDAEQVVILRGEPAVPPARLLDRLRDRHRGGHTVPLLCRDCPWRDQVDKRLLSMRSGHRRLLGRGVLAVRLGLGRRLGRRLGRWRGRLRRGSGSGGSQDRAGDSGDRGRVLLAGGWRGRRWRGRSRRGGRGSQDRAGDSGDRGRVLLAGGRPGRRRGGRRRRRSRRDGVGRLELSVVDEPLDAVVAERVAERVRVDREAGQRVGADRLERPADVTGHDLDVPVEHDPVAWPGRVPVAERVPAPVRLRVLNDGRDGDRGGIGVDPHVSPVGKRPRVGRAARRPGTLADGLRRELEREAGEGRAGRPVVCLVQAGVIPDQRLHLSRRPGPCELQVVLGHVDDRGSQQLVACRAARAVGAGMRGLLKCEQVQRDAAWRGHGRCRPRNEGQPGYRAARRHGYQRRCLLPPWFPDGLHGYSSPLRRCQS